MSSKYTQSPEELEKHLDEQVQFMTTSATAFDNGNPSEAKRLAVAIRVLVHDTKNSQSLLGQLGRKGMEFYDTALEIIPGNLLTQSAITGFLISTGSAHPVAPLDNIPPPGPHWVSFDDWWNRVIFVDKEKNEISRRGLVLSVANTDGGAHVDPTLPETYADLSRRNSQNWKYQGPAGESHLEGPELAAIRQIAHEVLKSLDPTMPTAEPILPENSAIFMGGEMTVDQTPARHPRVPKVGRNDPCPCGSGKKYKRCALA